LWATLEPRHRRSAARPCRPAAELHTGVNSPSGLWFPPSSAERARLSLQCARSRLSHMRTRRPSKILPSEITPRDQYLRRREFIAGAAALGLGSAIAALRGRGANAAPLQASKSPLSTSEEPLTPLKDITSYNNYYEFGTDKDDPARNAHTLTIKPWKIKIDGLVAKPADYDLDDLIKPIQLEERIYRMRC